MAFGVMSFGLLSVYPVLSTTELYCWTYLYCGSLPWSFLLWTFHLWTFLLWTFLLWTFLLWTFYYGSFFIRRCLLPWLIQAQPLRAELLCRRYIRPLWILCRLIGVTVLYVLCCSVYSRELGRERYSLFLRLSILLCKLKRYGLCVL